jgi:hypothetical protein
MGDNLKVLGQVSPSATSVTDLYTVPGSTQTAVAGIVICNRNATAITFRLSVAIAGAADAVDQYLYYDVSIAGNDTYLASIPVTLAATDKIRCYASATGVNFHAFGDEIA